MELIPVGLDVGTGFTKVSANGRTEMFPSLYGCTYAIRTKIEDVGKKQVKLEAVGKKAASIGNSRNGILIRPVKFGVPYNDHGFAMLAVEALKKTGIADNSLAAIAVGITFDAQASRKTIQRIISSKVRPALCTVLPQAYGTLVSCGKKQGTVVNIGHGTTEIIHIGPGGIEGTSIPKASEFVTTQLAKKSKRDAYLNYKSLFEAEPAQTARLSGLLAEHIADEVSRMSIRGDIILAGGGSQIPGMKESLERILGCELVMLDDPVFSNAKGLEKLAADAIKKMNSEKPAQAETARERPASAESVQKKPAQAENSPSSTDNAKISPP